MCLVRSLTGYRSSTSIHRNYNLPFNTKTHLTPVVSLPFLSSFSFVCFPHRRCQDRPLEIKEKRAKTDSHNHQMGEGCTLSQPAHCTLYLALSWYHIQSDQHLPHVRAPNFTSSCSCLLVSFGIRSVPSFSVLSSLCSSHRRCKDRPLWEKTMCTTHTFENKNFTSSPLHAHRSSTWYPSTTTTSTPTS